MTGKIGQGRAAIARQGSDEAVELEVLVAVGIEVGIRAYRAFGNIRELGVGQAGGNEGNQSSRELHLATQADIIWRERQSGHNERGEWSRRDM